MFKHRANTSTNYLTQTTSREPWEPWVPVRVCDYTLEDCKRGASFLRERTQHKPKIAIVIGSSLKHFLACLEYPNTITFEQLHDHQPLFATCSCSPGREAAFIFGLLDGVPVLVQYGRAHYFEGHSAQAVTFSVRIMHELGIETVIFSNVSRGLSPTLEIGDVMVISDHFNTERADTHPLTGLNIDAQGPRFLRCGSLYEAPLRRKARRIAKSKKIPLKQGVLVYISGPSFETPFEERCLRQLCERRRLAGRALRLLRRYGTGIGFGPLCDLFDRTLSSWGLVDTAICFNTVPEVLVADHCGMKVLAISGVHYVCRESQPTRPLGQVGIRERRLEEEKQNLIVPKMIALLRGVVAEEDEAGHDISMELDIREATAWRIPTKLCVSWTKVFVGTSVGALAFLLGPAVILQFGRIFVGTATLKR